ncbi:hypothetical protein ACOSP7_010425 [Xanthoceras sorbifolium]
MVNDLGQIRGKEVEVKDTIVISSEVCGASGFLEVQKEGKGVTGTKSSAGLTSVGDCDNCGVCVVVKAKPKCDVSSSVMSIIHQGVREADLGKVSNPKHKRWKRLAREKSAGKGDIEEIMESGKRIICFDD